MDRRSVLIGSGTALALTVAGCMEGENGGSDEPDDPQTGGQTDEDDNSNDDGAGELPWIDEEDLNRLSEYVTVTDVTLEDRTLKIVAKITGDSKKKGMTEIGHGVKKSITDVEALEAKVDWIQLVLYDGESQVFNAKISVDWIVKLVEEEIDVEELISHLEDKYDGG